MQRYFIQLCFDGTNYHGWQLQKNAHTVQAELNKALKTVFRYEVETLGCGRTDAGVHASKFYAHFDLPIVLNTIMVRDSVFKLNSILPQSIAVQNIYPVIKDASARFDASSRTYQYFIHHYKNPFLINRSYYRRIKPDIEKMNKAARLLLIHGDFACFSKSHTQVKTNICRIQEAEWFYKNNGSGENNQLVFLVKSDRFLRNMVRAIVGTLLDAGDGLLDLNGFKKVLDSKNRSKAGLSVPACGLFLTDIIYPKEIFEKTPD